MAGTVQLLLLSLDSCLGVPPTLALLALWVSLLQPSMAMSKVKKKSQALV